MANDIALEYQTAFLYEDDQSGVDRLCSSELESINDPITLLDFEYKQYNDYCIEHMEDTSDNKNHD